MWEKIKKNITPFAIGIAIPVLVGLASTFFTRNNMNILNELKTPPLMPPSLLFPIVWGILYVLMGISSAIVFINREKNITAAKTSFYYYVFSLAANFMWSVLFFNLGAFLFSFICLCILLFFILQTIIGYRYISKVSACLQFPYLIWVCFAGYLNISIFLLNNG